VLRPLAPVAVVQPNVPEDVKLREENRRRFIGIMAGATREALAAADPALVVWPETALPGFIVDHPDWVDSVRTLVGIEGAPILFGTIDLEWVDAFSTPPKYNYYNAALLADSLGRIDAQPPYRKKYLVPIVERVPFLNPQWFSGIDYFGGFGRGGEPPPFALSFGEVGTLICYESIYPQHARAFRQKGADLLANITNDAWFGHSSAPWQHFAHMRLRAIETRMAAVRSANTGISAYIDPLGRVVEATGLFVPAVHTWNVQTSDVITPYVRFGDWIGWLCLAGTAAICLMQWLRTRSLRRAGRAPATRAPLADDVE
jgi:apolipoprotein N-acyltransferase